MWICWNPTIVALEKGNKKKVVYLIEVFWVLGKVKKKKVCVCVGVGVGVGWGWVWCCVPTRVDVFAMNLFFPTPLLKSSYRLRVLRTVVSTNSQSGSHPTAETLVGSAYGLLHFWTLPFLFFFPNSNSGFA